MPEKLLTISESKLLQNGFLSGPVIELLCALYAYPKSDISNLKFAFKTRKINYGETWSSNDLRLNPNVCQSCNDWLRTISHEIVHHYQYQKSYFPAPLLRFRENVIKTFKGSMNSNFEKQAYQAGNLMKLFTMHYNPETVLLSQQGDEFKIKMLMQSVADFKKKLQQK